MGFDVSGGVELVLWESACVKFPDFLRYWTREPLSRDIGGEEVSLVVAHLVSGCRARERL